MVALAAADATLTAMVEHRVPEHLATVGARLFAELEGLADRYPDLISGVAGLPEMLFLRFPSEEAGVRLARAAARRGLLFKRTAYNFVSLAHDEGSVRRGVAILDEACRELRGQTP
jgi:4-aminobutyrate aminotransferase-like enzyme